MLKIFLLWRIGLLVVTYLGSLVLPKVDNGGLGAIAADKQFDYWLSWAQWDGGYYFKIAQSGYQQISDFAFFPLYPATVKIFAFAFNNNYLLAGLIASNLAFLVFLYLFKNLLTQISSPKIAYTTVISFLVFPTTFFAVAFYSESFFLLFAAFTFIFLGKRNYQFASFWAVLASLTRITGVFLAVSIIFTYLKNLKSTEQLFNKGFIYSLLSTTGIFGFSLYLSAHTGNPLQFISSQSFWLRTFSDPLSTFFSYLWAFMTAQARPFNDYFDFSITIVFLAILIWGVKKIPSSWWLFSILVLLIPTLTGTLTSMPRYLLAALGVFLIIGKYLAMRPNLKLLLWAVSLAAQALLASLFITGHWVA